jgi:hypothetical protein
MLLRQQKILFTHIPRTGGTSVEDYFFNKFNIKQSIFSMTSGKGGYSVNLGHSPYRLIKQDWLNSGERLDEEFLQFSIVRNPYAKTMSELFFWPDLGVSVDFVKNKDPKFRQEKIITALKVFLSNEHRYNKEWMWDHHLHTQNWFLQEIPDNYKVFKFEEGINNIMDKLGFEDFKYSKIRSQDKLAHYKLDDVKYEDYMNDEFIDLINSYYREDFERFGYKMK